MCTPRVSRSTKLLTELRYRLDSLQAVVNAHSLPIEQEDHMFTNNGGILTKGEYFDLEKCEYLKIEDLVYQLCKIEEKVKKNNLERVEFYRCDVIENSNGGFRHEARKLLDRIMTIESKFNK